MVTCQWVVTCPPCNCGHALRILSTTFSTISRTLHFTSGRGWATGKLAVILSHFLMTITFSRIWKQTFNSGIPNWYTHQLSFPTLQPRNLKNLRFILVLHNFQVQTRCRVATTRCRMPSHFSHSPNQPCPLLNQFCMVPSQCSQDLYRHCQNSNHMRKQLNRSRR